MLDNHMSNIIRVLIVDDHDLFRESLHSSLKKEKNLQVIGNAKNGKEAISLAKKNRPDVILMDINMPIMNGIEATKKIKQELPKIHIIALSMNDQDAIKKQFMSVGGSAFATKTSGVPNLLEIILQVTRNTERGLK